MFQWGYDHGIGKRLSFFYTEWAAILVNSNNYDKAIEIVQIGIDSDALPMDSLVRCMSDLKKKKLVYERSHQDVPNPNKINPKSIETETKKNQTDDEIDEKPLIKKFGFNYDLIKPDQNSEEEFSFEEIRALVYYKNYEEKSKYIEEINELKSK
jgi:hypothetical protein